MRTITMDTLSVERIQGGHERSRSPSPARSPAGGRKCKRHIPENMANDESYDIPVPVQNIGCQDLLEYKCSHCGWLRKRRGLLNQFLGWPQAYVVLREGCLYYFKNEKAKSAAGKFSLYGYNSVFRASEIQGKVEPWSFKIVHSHEEFKTYYFSASSEKEMKIWMSCVKKEMVSANGGSTIYRLKLAKEKEAQEEKLDDASFYQDIETNIYEGVHKFVPSQDYQKQCSIKKQNDDSDDEDLIDKRPPQPLPDDKRPFETLGGSRLDEIAPPIHTADIAPPLHKADIAPPIHKAVAKSRSAAPATPPRQRKNTPQVEEPRGVSVKTLAHNLGKVIGTTQKPSRLNRRSASLIITTQKTGSYEESEEFGFVPKSPDRQVDFRHVPVSEGGGSTGEDDPVPDLEEYWASIHFDHEDKQRAQEIINAIGDEGTYLVRPETGSDGKVLVVFSEDRAKKYRIQFSEEGEYFLSVTRKDKCLENLLCYYYEEDLPKTKTKLKVPYKLHKKYKNLQL